MHLVVLVFVTRGRSKQGKRGSLRVGGWLWKKQENVKCASKLNVVQKLYLHLSVSLRVP